MVTEKTNARSYAICSVVAMNMKIGSRSTNQAWFCVVSIVQTLLKPIDTKPTCNFV